MSPEHDQDEQRAAGRVAKLYALHSQIDTTGSGQMVIPAMHIRIPDVSHAKVDTEKTPVQSLPHAVQARPYGGDRSAGRIKKSLDALSPASVLQAIRQYPQAALAAAALVMALAVSTVVVQLRPDDPSVTRSDPPIPHANLAGGEGNSHPADVTHLRDVASLAGGAHHDDPEATDIQGVILGVVPSRPEESSHPAPNRPARLGNGPLAGMETSESTQPPPNTGATVSETVDSAGVARLKGYLEKPFTAEAIHGRDRPGLR